MLIKEFNADIHKLGFKGRNCFLRAVLGNKIDTIRFLHKIDKNLCKGKDEYGHNALTLASCYGSKETVEVLIKEFNADIHEVGYKGQNCFIQAARAGKIDTMRFLHKIDENLCKVKDNDGKTAFDHVTKETCSLLTELNIWPEELKLSLFENFEELGEGGMSQRWNANEHNDVQTSFLSFRLVLRSKNWKRRLNSFRNVNFLYDFC